MSDKVRASGESFQDPLPLALLACESVYRDVKSQKWTLLGLFGSLDAEIYVVVHSTRPAFAQ
jgi:hypothetical protein